MLSQAVFRRIRRVCFQVKTNVSSGIGRLGEEYLILPELSFQHTRSVWVLPPI